MTCILTVKHHTVCSSDDSLKRNTLVVTCVSVWDSDLQRRADGDDFVALGGVDLHQHRNRLL